MGTSYKALLRAFVITSALRGLMCFLKVCVTASTTVFHLSLCSYGKLAAAPSCFTREVRAETLALFIGFGLIGKGIHTCRRTFEFLTSGHLRHSGQIVTFFSAKGWLTINAPKRLSRSLHATLGSGSCVFLEFFSLLAEFTYCALSTVRLYVVNGSNPSIIYTRFMS